MWVFLLLISASARAEDVTVSTSKGAVVGQRTSEGYSTFFGIPYARVDERNPFGNSLEQPSFAKPFQATDSSILCPQSARIEGGILQCLTLNIYVPNQANANNKKPVFVWFFGGGFYFGYAGMYGGKYLVQRDIIVVTVNYRLGPYGFLCLNDPRVPGNQGLKDQITALKWIKTNIGAFGGDASKVTIAGESYGGGAVDFHLYSKYEQLFDKAIIQSASIYTPYIFVKSNHDAANELAEKLGHKSSNVDEALRFLATANPIEVMKASANLTELGPCKEKQFKGVENFITTDPLHFKKSDKVKNAHILIGHNSKETFNIFYNETDEFYKDFQNVFSDRLKDIFKLKNKELETLAKIVRDFYLGGKSIAPESMLELSDFLSDFMGNHAEERSVNNYLKLGSQKVYKYLFSYIGGSPYRDVPGAGAIHTEELQYLFDLAPPLTANLTTPEQIMMRDRMTEMWANFVKYGDPTPQVTDLLPVRWTPVTPGRTRPYLDIDVSMLVKDHVYHQRMAFWDLIWHKYVKRSTILQKDC